MITWQTIELANWHLNTDTDMELIKQLIDLDTMLQLNNVTIYVVT